MKNLKFIYALFIGFLTLTSSVGKTEKKYYLTFEINDGNIENIEFLEKAEDYENYKKKSIADNKNAFVIISRLTGIEAKLVKDSGFYPTNLTTLSVYADKKNWASSFEDPEFAKYIDINQNQRALFHEEINKAIKKLRNEEKIKSIINEIESEEDYDKIIIKIKKITPFIIEYIQNHKNFHTNLLKFCISFGDLKLYKELAENGLLGLENKDGNVLFDAIEGKRDIEIIQYLLDKGVNINSLPLCGGEPFLHMSFLNDDYEDNYKYEVRKVFLEAGADPDVKNEDGQSLIERKTELGLDEATTKLIKKYSKIKRNKLIVKIGIVFLLLISCVGIICAIYGYVANKKSKTPRKQSRKKKK